MCIVQIGLSWLETITSRKYFEGDNKILLLSNTSSVNSLQRRHFFSLLKLSWKPFFCFYKRSIILYLLGTWIQIVSLFALFGLNQVRIMFTFSVFVPFIGNCLLSAWYHSTPNFIAYSEWIDVQFARIRPWEIHVIVIRVISHEQTISRSSATQMARS